MKSYYEWITEMSKTDERELESRISVLIECKRPTNPC